MLDNEGDKMMICKPVNEFLLILAFYPGLPGSSCSMPLIELLDGIMYDIPWLFSTMPWSNTITAVPVKCIQDS